MINILSAAKEVEGVRYIDDLSNGFDYNNGWDWNRFAGTTSIHLPYENLRAENGLHRNYSDTSFLGAVSLFGEGAWGMDLHDNTFDKRFKAKKSVFMLENEVVVLGSDIENGDVNHNTETTLFQNAIFDTNAPIIFSDKKITDFPYQYKQSGNQSAWLMDPYGNGYFLPDANGLNISRSNQKSFKADGKTASSGNYSTAWIDHGANPSGAGYEYVIKINTTPEIRAQYSQKKTYTVLKKDSYAHVISTSNSGKVAYVIFDASAKLPKGGIIKQTDTPILAYSKKAGDAIKLSIADPDLRIGAQTESVMQNSFMKTAKITLNGCWKITSATPNARVIHSSAQETIIAFDCIDGKTIEVDLENLTSGADTTVNENTKDLKKNLWLIIPIVVILAMGIVVVGAAIFFTAKAHNKTKNKPKGKNDKLNSQNKLKKSKKE